MGDIQAVVLGYLVLFVVIPLSILMGLYCHLVKYLLKRDPSPKIYKPYVSLTVYTLCLLFFVFIFPYELIDKLFDFTVFIAMACPMVALLVSLPLSAYIKKYPLVLPYLLGSSLLIFVFLSLALLFPKSFIIDIILFIDNNSNYYL